MDHIIGLYPSITFDEFNLCDGIMYQTDMSQTISYDKQYFNKYLKYENTSTSNLLNKGRTDITLKYCDSLLDIGIGSGEFIKQSIIPIYGFDINPYAIKWLKDKDLFIDPYLSTIDVDGVTFWDSLEHIQNPSILLSLIPGNKYIFISIPIFKDLLNVKNSKHYRPNEHFYYFTEPGLISYMKDLNFSLIEITDFEKKAGRENITTFVFKN